jgi:hypothetical protein
MLVLDKVKYHLEGDFPADLPKANAYVLGGMFFMWCAENMLLSESTSQDFSQEIENSLSHNGLPSDVYRITGGVLSEEELNPVGLEFSKKYFDSDNGMYIDDFLDLLAENLPTAYHVEDSWENFNILRKKIDERFFDWKSGK